MFSHFGRRPLLFDFQEKSPVRMATSALVAFLLLITLQLANSAEIQAAEIRYSIIKWQGKSLVPLRNPDTLEIELREEQEARELLAQRTWTPVSAKEYQEQLKQTDSHGTLAAVVLAGVPAVLIASVLGIALSRRLGSGRAALIAYFTALVVFLAASAIVHAVRDMKPLDALVSSDDPIRAAMLAGLSLPVLYVGGLLVLLGRSGLDGNLYRKGMAGFAIGLFQLAIWPLLVLFSRKSQSDSNRSDSDQHPVTR